MRRSRLHPRRAFGRSSMPLARGTRSVMSLQTAANPALDNYAVTASAQPMLNAPGVDAVAAFDEIAQKFPGQLPGAGVTITNVSLGDLDDATAATNPADPCNLYATAYGPTTHLIGAQRYIDLPSMPLIPAYVGSPNGTLSGNGEVCGIDPFLSEIGLDFSVMAPLPHALQRPSELGNGLSDLLGIAPGASYRLVVPAATDEPSILGALLAAATQSPAPDIITTSIGWGLDRFGFPSRYLEDDALSRSVAATITGTYNIPLFIAANDGTRSGLGAPIGPSGGAAPTNVVPSGAPFTTLDDIGLTTARLGNPRQRRHRRRWHDGRRHVLSQPRRPGQCGAGGRARVPGHAFQRIDRFRYRLRQPGERGCARRQHPDAGPIRSELR